MATVVSQVGEGHYDVDYGGRIFKQSAEQLSHVTEREHLAQEAVRESQDPSRDMDHVSDEPFEILIDLFASPGSEHCEDSSVSEHCEDSRVSEHCGDSRVSEAHVHTQDRDRARPLKRRVEVSMRNLTREDRDAFTPAKQKEWASWLDKEAVELVKDRLKVPQSRILRARWVLTWKNVETEKVPIARSCALGFQDPRLTTLPTSSPTLTSDGESVILQWIVDEGHLLESGDLKTAFLSGDPDPAYKGSDALYIDPPSGLERWLNLGPEDALRLRKAVYSLINAPLRWHQRLSRALRQAGFVSLQMDPCVWISLRPVL